MDTFRTSAELENISNTGEAITIYKDYKLQTRPDTKVKLIERVEKGLSFIIYNEKLFTKLEDRVIGEQGHEGHLPLDKEQLYRNRVFAKLSIHLQGIKRSGVHHVDADMNTMYQHLSTIVTTDINNPNVLKDIITQYKTKWGSKRDFFEEFDNTTIIRFIQQTCLNKWAHSIWRIEKWIVQYPSDGYSSPFRTTRSIRTLVCISPNEEGQNSGILHYITKGNSIISNADRKEIRLEELELKFEDEDVIFNEDELEFIHEEQALDVQLDVDYEEIDDLDLFEEEDDADDDE